jgi:hypothetical protein
MKKSRLQELAGMQHINEQSERISTLIRTMSKELATDLGDDLSDPINVVIPEIIKRLTVVANDPKSGLSSAERAQIKDEIKKYQQALDTISSADLAPALEANTSTQKSVVSERQREGSITTTDLVLKIHVPLELFKEVAEDFDNTLIDDFEDPTKKKAAMEALALTMEDDFNTWFDVNGDEWLEDAIGDNKYDDFLIEPTD